MTEVEKPTWRDGAPEQKDNKTSDPGDYFTSGDSWSPNFGDAAKTVDGVKHVDSIIKSGSKTVDAFNEVDSLTDWGGLWNLANTFSTEVASVGKQVEGFVKVVKEFMGNPLDWLAGTIVDFLLGCFEPLNELVMLVSGNEALMKHSATMWDSVTEGAPQVAQFITQTGQTSLQSWEGEASNAARTRVDEVGQGLEIMGYAAVGMKHLMLQSAELAKAAYKKVKELLADGVEWVLTRIAPYIASSFATLGAAVPVAVADTVRKIVTLVIDAYNWIKQAIQIFTTAVQSMQIFQQIVTKVQPVLQFLGTIKKHHATYEKFKKDHALELDLGAQVFK